MVGAYDSTRALPSEIMKGIVDTMREILKDCSTVLDVGVGTGRFACPINDNGFRVVGVDISVPMMLRAREKGLRDLVKTDANRLPFNDDSFDAVLMVHLLHLVDDWVGLVHEIGRVARHLVVSVVYRSKGFSARKDYLMLRQKMGCPLKRFNEAEEGLRKVLTPTTIIHVGEYKTTVNAEAAIASLEKGDFAIAWDLPEEFHSKIIRKLRSEYGGGNYPRTETFDVAVWEPEQLLTLRKQ